MNFIVGIDEVGRGPLAGPVSVCVVCCDVLTYKKLKRLKRLPKRGLDSKKLTFEEREKYSDFLKICQKENKIFYSINHISNKIIDSKGLTYAINRSIKQGIKKLKLDPNNSEVLLDGGLKAPKEFLKQTTIIKGDEKEKIISWASILAKVSRDSLMKRNSKKFPMYEFETHKGYATPKHRLLIQKNGLTSLHRATFCRNIDFAR